MRGTFFSSKRNETNAFRFRERDLKPHFAEPNTIEQTIGLKWKELELQEKQLLDEVKRRMQFASEQLQVEIDQMLLDHQAQLMREGKSMSRYVCVFFIMFFDRSENLLRCVD